MDFSAPHPFQDLAGLPGWQLALGAPQPSSASDLRTEDTASVPDACSLRTKEKRTNNRWRPEEQALLLRLVEEQGDKKRWSKIADKIPGRTGKQCRERWMNHLRPDIRRDKWTQAEEETLVRAHARIGSHWTVIAQELEGRTENAIKNLWNTTIRTKTVPDERSVLWDYINLLKCGASPAEALQDALHPPAPGHGWLARNPRPDLLDAFCDAQDARTRTGGGGGVLASHMLSSGHLFETVSSALSSGELLDSYNSQLSTELLDSYSSQYEAAQQQQQAALAQAHAVRAQAAARAQQQAAAAQAQFAGGCGGVAHLGTMGSDILDTVSSQVSTVSGLSTLTTTQTEWLAGIAGHDPMCSPGPLRTPQPSSYDSSPQLLPPHQRAAQADAGPSQAPLPEALLSASDLSGYLASWQKALAPAQQAAAPPPQPAAPHTPLPYGQSSRGGGHGHGGSAFQSYRVRRQQAAEPRLPTVVEGQSVQAQQYPPSTEALTLELMAAFGGAGSSDSDGAGGTHMALPESLPASLDALSPSALATVEQAHRWHLAQLAQINQLREQMQRQLAAQQAQQAQEAQRMQQAQEAQRAQQAQQAQRAQQAQQRAAAPSAAASQIAENAEQMAQAHSAFLGGRSAASAAGGAAAFTDGGLWDAMAQAGWSLEMPPAAQSAAPSASVGQGAAPDQRGAPASLQGEGRSGSAQLTQAEWEFCRAHNLLPETPQAAPPPARGVRPRAPAHESMLHRLKRAVTSVAAPVLPTHAPHTASPEPSSSVGGASRRSNSSSGGSAPPSLQLPSRSILDTFTDMDIAEVLASQTPGSPFGRRRSAPVGHLDMMMLDD